MKRIAYAVLPTLALLSISTTPVSAQSLRSEIVGTWVVTDLANKRANGTETHPWGKDVTGRFIYGADGSYTQVQIGEKQAAFKTDEVRRPDSFLVVQIGTYTVDPDNKTVHVKVQRAGNSVRDGLEFADTVALNGDQMTVTGAPRQDKDGQFQPIQILRRFKPEDRTATTK